MKRSLWVGSSASPPILSPRRRRLPTTDRCPQRHRMLWARRTSCCNSSITTPRTASPRRWTHQRCRRQRSQAHAAPPRRLLPMGTHLMQAIFFPRSIGNRTRNSQRGEEGRPALRLLLVRRLLHSRARPEAFWFTPLPAVPRRKPKVALLAKCLRRRAAHRRRPLPRQRVMPTAGRRLFPLLLL